MAALIYRSATAGQTRAGMANRIAYRKRRWWQDLRDRDLSGLRRHHHINPSTGKVLGAEAALIARR
jgi:hypothetical protein